MNRDSTAGLGGRRAWVVWTAALLVYLLAVFHRSSLGVAGILAAERFHISSSQLSTFIMVQLLVYAGMQIPVGVLLDRFGSQRMLFTGMVLMTLAQCMFAFATSYPVGLAARVVIGIGDAMIFISLLRVVALWFPPLRTPVVTQLSGMLGQIGAIAAAVPLSAALHDFGWERTYLVSALLGIVLIAAIVLVVRDAPPGREPEPTRLNLSAVKDQVLQSWRQDGTRLGLWSHFSTQSNVHIFGLLWGFPFLVTVHHLSATEAGWLLTLMTAVSIVAGPFLGHLVATRPFYRSTMVLAIVGAIALCWTVVLLWPGPAPLWVLAILVVVIGTGGPGALVGFDLARTFNPASRFGSASGIVNVGGFVAALSAVLGIGIVLDVLTPGRSTDYAPIDFRWAMCVQYGIWLIGTVQILRYRRRARRTLAETDPEGYESLRRGIQRPAR